MDPVMVDIPMGSLLIEVASGVDTVMAVPAMVTMLVVRLPPEVPAPRRMISRPGWKDAIGHAKVTAVPPAVLVPRTVAPQSSGSPTLDQIMRYCVREVLVAGDGTSPYGSLPFISV